MELTNVLLESGTNELEIMEFTIDGKSYGINVAKVLEIMKYEKVTPMPNSLPFIEGIFKPRNKIMTVIDLPLYLGANKNDDDSRDIFIITTFNKTTLAFHVHSVEVIHRISWTDVEEPDPTIYGDIEGMATGIVKLKDKLITIIDFEKILYELNPSSGINLDSIASLKDRAPIHKPIFIAEDSPILMKLIQNAIRDSGYTNITVFSNGYECWEEIKKLHEKGVPLHDVCSCLITDIEMPKMDGHHLLKNIRDDEFLFDLPVIIFSSLIDDNMRLKGNDLGATAQITKPEISLLVGLLDKYSL